MDHSGFGKQFYPTPLPLALKMVSMIQWDNNGAVLDLAAGKGDLLAAAALRHTSSFWKFFKGNRQARDNGPLQFTEIDLAEVNDTISDERFQKEWQETIRRVSSRLWAIEIDESLQHVLRGNGYRVIGSDFFSYSGAMQPSYILMNPPFESGCQFLLRAIDFLYSGQICCQLNAQTLLNPYSLERQMLVKRLTELNATVEYLDGQYIDAERPTGVQIALVYIDKRVAMDEVFGDMADKANDNVRFGEQANSSALVSSDRIVALVEHYEAQKNAGIEVLLDFHKRARSLQFLDIQVEGFETPSFRGDERLARTELFKAKANAYLTKLREKHWTEMMSDPAVTRWLTKSKKEDYLSQLSMYSAMDFTEKNIRNFVSKISAAYPETLSAAIEDVFDEFTVKYAYHEDTGNNVHMFSGWLSNKAAFVNKKVVIPRMSPYDISWKQWRPIGFQVRERLADFEKVLAYFEGGGRLIEHYQGVQNGFVAMSDLIDEAVRKGQTSKIETEFFWVTVYMKGTIHLTFKDQELRRRFNVFVGSRRAYLPPDYAKKPYAEMDAEERRVVAEFEGEKAYKVDERCDPFGAMRVAIQSNQQLQLPMAA